MTTYAGLSVIDSIPNSEDPDEVAHNEPPHLDLHGFFLYSSLFFRPILITAQRTVPIVAHYSSNSKRRLFSSFFFLSIFQNDVPQKAKRIKFIIHTPGTKSVCPPPLQLFLNQQFESEKFRKEEIQKFDLPEINDSKAGFKHLVKTA